MTTISKTSKVVTLINVFTVEPANQRQLLELLDRATETSVRHARGFISSSLHRSLDGNKVHDVRPVAQRRGLPVHARESRSSTLLAAGVGNREVRARDV